MSVRSLIHPTTAQSGPRLAPRRESGPGTRKKVRALEYASTIAGALGQSICWRRELDEGLVLKIGGWKTRAMLDRYNVTDITRLSAAMEKGGKFVTDRIAVAGASR